MAENQVLGFFERIIKESATQRAIEEKARKEAAAAARGVDVSVIEEEERQAEELRAEENRKAQEQRDAEEAERRRAALQARAELGASLGLPVPAHIGHIMRLAGLTERSSGNGMVSNTVWHIVLDGPFSIGRLTRSKNDLLCRKASGIGRKKSLYVSGTDFWEDDPSWIRGPVTCTACLEIMARLKALKEKTEAGNRLTPTMHKEGTDDGK